MKEVFKELPMLSYGRYKHFCDILVLIKENKLTKTTGGEDQCSRRVCQAVQEAEINEVAGNKTYITFRNPICTLQNVIHALLCDRCKMAVYV